MFSSGGHYDGSSPFWAGERGPELIFPTGSGTVVDNKGSMALAGGDAEVVGLLKLIIAQNDKRQSMSLVLEDGRTLKGYVQATADELDQNRLAKRISNRTYR
jgi:hypothetical protein